MTCLSPERDVRSCLLSAHPPWVSGGHLGLRDLGEMPVGAAGYGLGYQRTLPVPPVSTTGFSAPWKLPALLQPCKHQPVVAGVCQNQSRAWCWEGGCKSRHCLATAERWWQRKSGVNTPWAEAEAGSCCLRATDGPSTKGRQSVMPGSAGMLQRCLISPLSGNWQPVQYRSGQ